MKTRDKLEVVTRILWVIIGLLWSGIFLLSAFKAHAQTTPPSTPTNLTVSAVGADKLRVSWDAAGGATSYDLWRWNYYSTPPQFERLITTTKTVVTDTVGCGETQFYQVRSSNGISLSEFTPWVMQTANACVTVPVTVTAPPSTPTNLTVSAVGADKLRVSWDAAGGATSYDLWRWNYYSTPPQFERLITTTKTVVTDTVGCGETQFYQVRSSNGISLSEFTPWVMQTANACAQAPATVTVTAVSSASLKLSWSAVADAVSYKLYAWSPQYGQFLLLTTVPAPAVSYTETVGCGVERWYEVASYNGVTESVHSQMVMGTTSACPTNQVPMTPNPLVMNQSPTSIMLTWADVAGAENYLIYKKIGSLFLLYSSTSAGVLTWTDADLTCNTIQYYKVSARNVYGDSAMSAEIAVPTLQCQSYKVLIPLAVR